MISENAFIEFIKYNKQDLELKDESIKDYELRENEKKIAIIIKKTLKDFYFGLESQMNLHFLFHMDLLLNVIILIIIFIFLI